jgi:hypothetical protein
MFNVCRQFLSKYSDNVLVLSKPDLVEVAAADQLDIPISTNFRVVLLLRQIIFQARSSSKICSKFQKSPFHFSSPVSCGAGTSPPLAPPNWSGQLASPTQWPMPLQAFYMIKDLSIGFLGQKVGGSGLNPPMAVSLAWSDKPLGLGCSSP